MVRIVMVCMGSWQQVAHTTWLRTYELRPALATHRCPCQDPDPCHVSADEDAWEHEQQHGGEEDYDG